MTIHDHSKNMSSVIWSRVRPARSLLKINNQACRYVSSLSSCILEKFFKNLKNQCTRTTVATKYCFRNFQHPSISFVCSCVMGSTKCLTLRFVLVCKYVTVCDTQSDATTLRSSGSCTLHTGLWSPYCHAPYNHRSKVSASLFSDREW